MNRRDFLKSMATITLGSLATNEAVEALTNVYDKSAPVVPNLISFRDFILTGYHEMDKPVRFKLMNKENPIFIGAMNLMGGNFRWVAAPNDTLSFGKLEDFRWDIISDYDKCEETKLEGHAMWTTQAGEWFHGSFKKSMELSKIIPVQIVREDEV